MLLTSCSKSPSAYILVLNRFHWIIIILCSVDVDDRQKCQQKTIMCLTLSVPHFSDCGKNESTKAFSAILVWPTRFSFLTFWHSGLSARVPECQKIKKSGLDLNTLKCSHLTPVGLRGLINCHEVKAFITDTINWTENSHELDNKVILFSGKILHLVFCHIPQVITSHTAVTSLNEVSIKWCLTAYMQWIIPPHWFQQKTQADWNWCRMSSLGDLGIKITFQQQKKIHNSQ